MTSFIPPLLKEVDVVFTMLPSRLIVKDIINEFVCDFSAKSTWIDCSTIDAKTTKELCEILHKKDIFMLGAPVSGGIQGVKSSSLKFMVGETKEYFKI